MLFPEQRGGSMFSPVGMRGTARRARHYRERGQPDPIARLVASRKRVRPGWEREDEQKDYMGYLRGSESQRRVAELLDLLCLQGFIRSFFETEKWSLLDMQGVDFWGELMHGGMFKVDAVSSEGGVRREYEEYEGENILVFAPRAHCAREEDALRLFQQLVGFFGSPSP